MTLGEALRFGRQRLSFSDSAALDARLLLAHLLKVDHSYLLAHDEQVLTDSLSQAYGELIERAARREPIPYLTGRAPFFGLTFTVSPAVLIPRPETELLVEAALAWAQGRGRLEVVDVGTGSGCIAVSLALRLPAAQVSAVDLSPAALEIAGQNAAEHGLAGCLRFFQGHLLEPLDFRADLIVANLPYIADHEWTIVDDGVKWYEPDIALRGGPDGLDIIRQLLDQAATRLATGGAIFLEIGWQLGPAVKRLARDYFNQARVEVKPDFAGHDRIVSITT